MTPVSDGYIVQISPLRPVNLKAFKESTTTYEAKTKVVAAAPSWRTPLYGCFSSCVPNCCTVSFCPCISLAQISSRLGESFEMALLHFGLLVTGVFISFGLCVSALSASEYDEQHPDSRGTSSSNPIAFAVCAVVTMIILAASTASLRSKTRAKFALPGSKVIDFALSLFCGPCVIAQLAVQLQTFTPGSCNLVPLSEDEGHDVLPELHRETFMNNTAREIHEADVGVDKLKQDDHDHEFGLLTPQDETGGIPSLCTMPHELLQISKSSLRATTSVALSVCPELAAVVIRRGRNPAQSALVAWSELVYHTLGW